MYLKYPKMSKFFVLAVKKCYNQEKFSGIFMHSTVKNKQNEIRALCLRYRVQRMALFGSAVGTAFDPEKSDVDFLVAFQPMSPVEHKKAYFGLLAELESLFGRPVDLVEFQTVRNPYVRRNIERQQEILYAAA